MSQLVVNQFNKGETEEKAKELLDTGEELIDEDADKAEKKDATEDTTETNNDKKAAEATERNQLKVRDEELQARPNAPQVLLNVKKKWPSKGDGAKKNVKNKENKSQKKRFRGKHTKDEKEVPELRVIPKTEWLKLRSEYLKLQKTSMAMLKKSLRNAQSNEMQTEDKSAPSKHKNIEFVADVIVRVHSEVPLHRQKLKENLGEDVKVAYIDIVGESSDGFIRCQDSVSAKAIADKKLEGLTFTLVSGDDGKQYWDKLEADRESKLNKKCRHKKRGHQKWMEKAQKASIENFDRKHVVFDVE